MAQPLPLECQPPNIDYQKCCAAMPLPPKGDACDKWQQSAASQMTAAVDTVSLLRSLECAANKSCPSTTSYFETSVKPLCATCEQKYNVWMIIVPSVIAVLAVLFALMRGNSS
jgi:hypothetical protein